MYVTFENRFYELHWRKDHVWLLKIQLIYKRKKTFKRHRSQLTHDWWVALFSYLLDPLQGQHQPLGILLLQLCDGAKPILRRKDVYKAPRKLRRMKTTTLKVQELDPRSFHHDHHLGSTSTRKPGFLGPQLMVTRNKTCCLQIATLSSYWLLRW